VEGRGERGLRPGEGQQRHYESEHRVRGDRKTLSDEAKLYASSIYSTNGPTSSGNSGGVTANEIWAVRCTAATLRRKLFGFGSGDFTHDELQNLTLRQIYSGGLGWHAVNDAKTSLDFIGGVNYTRESYSSGNHVNGVGRNLAGITAGENFTRKFGANTLLTEISVSIGPERLQPVSLFARCRRGDEDQ